MDELLTIQEKKLKSILHFAYNHSIFYKTKFDELGLIDWDKPFDTLSKLSIIRKADLINYNEDIHTVKSYKFKKLFFSETSGSSGEPLVFYKNEHWDSSNRASIARGMSWYGVEPWERNGYFFGYSFSFFAKLKISMFDWLLNRFKNIFL